MPHPSASAPLFFLETGLGGGDLLFDRESCRRGIALWCEAGGRVLCLARSGAPPRQGGAFCEIRVLRLHQLVRGHLLEGEVPEGTEDILLDNCLFRGAPDGYFRGVLKKEMRGALQ